MLNLRDLYIDFWHSYKKGGLFPEKMNKIIKEKFLTNKKIEHAKV